MRFYYLIGRLSGPVQRLGFYAYNLVFKTPRARVIVRNENGDILLVKNWATQEYWGLPGGGIKRGETAAEGAQRELREETGLTLPIEQFTLLDTIRHIYPAAVFTITISASLLDPGGRNRWEIYEMAWFTRDALPANLSNVTIMALKKLSK